MPERPVSAESILADVAETHKAYGHVVMVLSENQPGPDGHVLGSGGQPRHVDAFNHAYYDSPAEHLVQPDSRATGAAGALGEVRHAPADVDLVPFGDGRGRGTGGRSGGRPAGAQRRNGPDGRVQRVSDEPYQWALGTTPLATVANEQRLLPPDMVPEPRGGPTPAFRQYAEPLLGAPLPATRATDVGRQVTGYHDEGTG